MIKEYILFGLQWIGAAFLIWHVSRFLICFREEAQEGASAYKSFNEFKHQWLPKLLERIEKLEKKDDKSI